MYSVDHDYWRPDWSLVSVYIGVSDPLQIFSPSILHSLVANIIIGEVTEPLQRTVVFGMLHGCNLLGQGIGHISKIYPLLQLCIVLTETGAGIIGDAWGIRRPFEIAFGLFLLTTLYVRVAVPYVESLSSASKPESKGIGLLSPLRVLAPQKVLLSSGVIRKHYGVLYLCAGVFLGVVSSICCIRLVS